MKLRALFRGAGLAAALLCLFIVVLPVRAQGEGQLEVIRKVEQEVEELRGLDFLKEVEVRFLTREELEAKLVEDLNEDYTPEEWERDEGLLKLLGFLEEDQDYYTIILELLTEQIAGFYTPKEKYLALIAGEEEFTAYGRLILSHELTHALQDQHFNLDRPPYHDPDSTNGDADLAATTLVEGDATTIMYDYMNEYFTPRDMREMSREQRGFQTEKMDTAPRYIRDSLLFPYDQGEVFVGKAKRRGGNAALNEAFGRPPVSTEQVMHPEKYFAAEGPLPVECPDIATYLGSGWELRDTNVIGEFDVKELLMNELDENDAARGAEGWGGCQYRYYTGPGGAGRLQVVDLLWDDRQEAEEFAALFADYAEGFCGDKEADFDAGSGWAQWSGGARMAALCLDGELSRIVITDEEQAVGLAMKALGEGDSRLEEIIRKDGSALGKTTEEEEAGSGVRVALVLAVVVALFIIGAALIAAMFFLLRGGKPPAGPPLPGSSGSIDANIGHGIGAEAPKTTTSAPEAPSGYEEPPEGGGG